MMLKVFDLLKSLGWYIVDFIYGLIESILQVIKELNAFDIINSLSDNTVFKGMYTGLVTIAITLFALFVIWKFISKMLEPDDEPITIKMIWTETLKCGFMIMLSTFLFVQVSNFSITLSSWTGNLFETTSNTKMSATMLSMYITYTDHYKDSDKFDANTSIEKLVSNGKFNSGEKYIEKYVTKSKLIFADDQDYKYEINWIMAILCGGFFLYALFFAGIMLGRRQIEFLFLFAIAPIVFATSVCNKQRRGAVIEQLVSLVLQSAVIMLIVNLTVMVMQQINNTTFFDNGGQDLLIKSLLYLGCATFILTGSQVINRFIGSNVSAASGREQLMSMMGFGKMATAGAVIGGASLVGAGLVGTGLAMKGGDYGINQALTTGGMTLGTMGASTNPNRVQRAMNTLGAKMHSTGQMRMNAQNDKPSASSSFINAGVNSFDQAFRTVAPRASYNTSLYRRNKGNRV